MRPLLLALLLIWALTVFGTVDLFLNVPEFDAARPRAPFYRGLRAAGHRLVGEPYREDDSLDRSLWVRSGPGARSQAAIQGEGEPCDPATLLQDVGSRNAPEIRALLRQLQDRPDPALANALLEARFQIPEDLLRDYGLAAASTVAAPCPPQEGPGYSSSELLTGVRGDLALAALEAQARGLDVAPSELGPNAWRSARVTTERIAWVAPGFEHEPPYVDALMRVRAALERFLETAEVGTSTETQVEALRLAALVGDGQTARACAGFVRRRGVESGRSAFTREGFLVLEHALRTVAHRGDSHDQAEMLDWLARAEAQARNPAAQRRLEYLVRLMLAPRASPGMRELVERAPAVGGHPLRRR